MPIDYRVFIHPDDLKALEALRKVPGFDKLAKKFTEEVWERLYRIENLSSCIKLGPKQMPKIYNLLPPICKKLQIPEPELYLSLDRDPNAYTVGDTATCIVITSGLVETMSKKEIEVVLAHECGHILCRHCLYHTMGSWLLTATDVILSNHGLLNLLTIPLRYAFYHWMRCSEFSADRVSAYCVGGADRVSDVMIRLAGGTSNLHHKVNKELFMQQAKDYKEQMDVSTVDKLFELYMYRHSDHPLVAYRAYQVTEWCKTDVFRNIQKDIKMLPEEYAHNTQKKVHLDLELVDHLDKKELARWCEDKEYLSGDKIVYIRCDKAEKDFSDLAKKKIDLNKAVYQAILSKDNTPLRHRVVAYNSISKDLEKQLSKKEGENLLK